MILFKQWIVLVYIRKHCDSKEHYYLRIRYTTNVETDRDNEFLFPDYQKLHTGGMKSIGYPEVSTKDLVVESRQNGHLSRIMVKSEFTKSCIYAHVSGNILRSYPTHDPTKYY